MTAGGGYAFNESTTHRPTPVRIKEGGNPEWRLTAPRAVILELARESRGTKPTTCGACTHQQQDGFSLPVTLGLAPEMTARSTAYSSLWGA